MYCLRQLFKGSLGHSDGANPFGRDIRDYFDSNPRRSPQTLERRRYGRERPVRSRLRCRRARSCPVTGIEYDQQSAANASDTIYESVDPLFL